MSDASTFMSLPSLVRQALENTGGELGREVDADAYGAITINNCDYLILRDYIVTMREKELKCEC